MFRYRLLEHQALMISWLSEGGGNEKDGDDAAGSKRVVRRAMPAMTKTIALS